MFRSPSRDSLRSYRVRRFGASSPKFASFSCQVLRHSHVHVTCQLEALGAGARSCTLVRLGPPQLHGVARPCAANWCRPAANWRQTPEPVDPTVGLYCRTPADSPTVAAYLHGFSG